MRLGILKSYCWGVRRQNSEHHQQLESMRDMLEQKKSQRGRPKYRNPDKLLNDSQGKTQAAQLNLRMAPSVLSSWIKFLLKQTHQQANQYSADEHNRTQISTTYHLQSPGHYSELLDVQTNRKMWSILKRKGNWRTPTSDFRIKDIFAKLLLSVFHH